MEKTNVALTFPQVAADLDALLNSALGTPYAEIDALVMSNDMLIFRNYLTAGLSVDAQKRLLNSTFKGFDESDWQRIVAWNATSPQA